MVLARSLALLALPATLVAAPGNGSIRGQVQLLREQAAAAPRPTVSELGASRAPDAPDRRQSVVYLEAGPRRAFEEHAGGRATLDQRNESFVPYVLAVTVGTVVDFLNSDRTYHNVFSLSKTQRFDLGRYGRGRSKSVRFDRPGVVRVFCDIHSHMSAFVLVFAHRFFAATDAEGRYRIENVPPGAYNLVAWNDGQERESRSIRLGDGETVEADFRLR